MPAPQLGAVGGATRDEIAVRGRDDQAIAGDRRRDGEFGVERLSPDDVAGLQRQRLECVVFGDEDEVGADRGLHGRGDGRDPQQRADGHVVRGELIAFEREDRERSRNAGGAVSALLSASVQMGATREERERCFVVGGACLPDGARDGTASASARAPAMRARR